MNLRKGFTLIELLVVIAIIGLLSSVVLASLNGARQRGADTTIKGQMNALRAAAELHYDNNGSSYATFCASAPVTAALAAMRTAAGPSATATGVAYATAGAAATVTCHSAAGAWAIESPLRSNAANFWCVDSNGLSEQNVGTALAASDTDC